MSRLLDESAIQMVNISLFARLFGIQTVNISLFGKWRYISDSFNIQIPNTVVQFMAYCEFLVFQAMAQKPDIVFTLHSHSPFHQPGHHPYYGIASCSNL